MDHTLVRALIDTKAPVTYPEASFQLVHSTVGTLPFELFAKGNAKQQITEVALLYRKL